MKKSLLLKGMFTLIELIVVIVILGILAAIIVPNVKDMKQDAIVSTIEANIRNLQTASDLYSLRNNGEFPTALQPTPENPQLIDINLLYPTYIKSEIDYQKIKEQRYWVDAWGRVWGATADSPEKMLRGTEKLEWEIEEKVVGYNVYQLEQNKATGKVTASKRDRIVSFGVNEEIDIASVTHEDKTILISSIDQYGLESAPVGPEYFSSSDGFQPIRNREGTFYFEIKSKRIMYWDDFFTKEDLPEGTSINYEFAVMEGEQYSSFQSDFNSLPASKGIKVKINMKGVNGKNPSLLMLKVLYHFGDKEDQITLEPLVKDDFLQIPVIGSENQPLTISYDFKLPEEHYVSSISGYNPYPNGSTSYSYSTDNYTFTPVPSLQSIPSDATVRVEYTYPSGGGVPPKPPVVKVSPAPPEVVDVDKVIKQEIKWDQLYEVNFFAISSDGQKVKWLDAIIEDNQPEHTRIVYSYATSEDGIGWSGYSENIADTSEDVYVKVNVSFQIEEGYEDKVEEPQLISLQLINSEGEAEAVKDKVPVLAKANYYSFDGNDYIDTGLRASQLGIEGRKPKTFEVWAKTRQFNINSIFSIGAAQSGREISLRTASSTNSWRGQFWGATTHDIDFVYDSANKWTHFAIVYDGSTMRIYANGQLVGSRTTVYDLADTTPLQIGRWISQGGSYFVGEIDDLRVWNVARTQSEIQASMDTELLGTEKGLVANWTFNKIIDGQTVDSTPNQYKATVHGATAQ